jgi:hypothetical protein
LRPAIFAENVGTLELDRFHAERAPGGSPAIQVAGLGQLVVDGKPAAVAKANVSALKMPQDPPIAGDPFSITETVQNIGAAGLAEVPLRLGTQTVPRSVWLQSGEKADVTFTNLDYATPGEISLRAGQLGKILHVLQKHPAQPINSPFKTFHNVTATFDQFNNSFYIRAGGNATVMHYGNQYASIYLDQRLPPNATVVVKVDNPDLRSNWPGLSGILVRNHIDQPGTSGPYVILGSSPAAGTYLDWAGEGSGVVNHRVEAEGFTIWPRWLKLQRQGARFIASSSIDNVHWTEVGQCDVPGAKETLDVGMFAFRSSARFTDFAVKAQ